MLFWGYFSLFLYLYGLKRCHFHEKLYSPWLNDNFFLLCYFMDVKENKDWKEEWSYSFWPDFLEDFDVVLWKKEEVCSLFETQLMPSFTTKQMQRPTKGQRH